MTISSDTDSMATSTNTGLRGLLTLTALVAIAWTAYQVYTALRPGLPVITQRGLHVAFALALAFALSFEKCKRRWEAVLAVLLMIAAVAVGLHYLLDATRLMSRIPFVTRLTTQDLIMSALLTILVVEATRRTMGKAMVVFVVVAIAYGFTGPYFEGLLAHRGFTINRMLELQGTSIIGILGSAVMVSLNYVFYFVLFGAMLEATGGGRLLINVSIALTGALRSGPAMAAVVASSIMGSINGSAVANVVSTGILTIPLIKKRGYPAAFAAATEAAASSGGQLMPPIMGAAAFILAETIGIPYRDVVLAAILPAVVYYVAIGVRVHFEALRLDITPMAPEEGPSLWEEIRDRGHLVIAPIVLVYLIFNGYTPTSAAMMGTITLLVLSLLRPATRVGLVALLHGSANAGRQAVMVAVPCAAAGIIVGIVEFSNLGLRLSDIIIGIAAGNLALLLILAAGASIVLGMGMPSVSAYIVASILVAPALVTLGVLPLAAHLFVFYFAILSMVTPPVALASYAAAGIAQADTTRVSFLAVQLSLPAYLLPFAFVYNPGILLEGTITSTIWGTFTILVGSTALAAALAGYLAGRLPVWTRLLLFAFGLLVIVPEPLSSVVGTLGCLLILSLMIVRARRDDRLAAETVGGGS